MTTIKHKCPNCETGVVEEIIIETKTFVTARVKSCDSCKKPFGLKAVSKLPVI